jgi:hypothetical protein
MSALSSCHLARLHEDQPRLHPTATRKPPPNASAASLGILMNRVDLRLVPDKLLDPSVRGLAQSWRDACRHPRHPSTDAITPWATPHSMKEGRSGDRCCHSWALSAAGVTGGRPT